MKSEQFRKASKTCYCWSLGIILIATGSVSIFFWTSIFDFILNSELTLRPNSRTFKVWEQAPFPLQIDFYLFNWTNYDEVNDKTIKPRFEEIGPYRFKEIKKKVDIVWNENNETVTYSIMKQWFYDEDYEDNKSLDDIIVTVNPISTTVAYQAKEWSYMIKKGISLSLNNMAPDVHVVRTVGQLLFEGYEDPFINLARNMPFLTGVRIPDVDRFGWFYGRNGSSSFDGTFNMATGLGDEEFGELLNWKYTNESGYFPDECGRVQGSAGELYTQNRKKDQLTLFSPDLCRPMTLDFDQEVVVEGIKTYKYSGGESLMDNGTNIPENRCYCVGDCQPSGTLNVSTCRYGSPAFVSFPHFYYGDDYYTDTIEGMRPSKEKHEFYLALEPRTGIPMAVAARLQLNILLQPDNHIGIFQEVPKVFFPVLWFEQKISVTPEMAQQISLLLQLPSAGTICSGIAVGIGIFIIVFIAAIPVTKSIKKLFQNDNHIMCKEEIPLNEKELEMKTQHCIVITSKSDRQ